MRINKTNDINNQRITMLIYSASGIGKTTLAKTLNDKTLIISAEGGLNSLLDSDIPYIDITKGDDNLPLKDATSKFIRLGQAVNFIKNGTEYQTIFLDSLTEIGQIIAEHFQLLYPKAKNSLRMWGEYSKTLRSFIKTIRDMAPYNIVFTALEQVDKDELGRRYSLPDVQGKLAKQLPQFFDEVYIYKIFQKEDKETRALVTRSSDQFIAKTRINKVDQYEKPNLGLIFKKLRGENERI